MKGTKIIFFILSIILVILSCEKEDDNIVPVEDISRRIASKKHYSNGVLNSANNYVYDNYGRLISLETTHYNENGETNYSYSRTFEYEQSKIIDSQRYYSTGLETGHKTDREIENGRVSKILSYQWNGAVWDLVSRTSYIYNGSKLCRWNKINLSISSNNMTEGEIMYDGDLPMQKIEKHHNYDDFGTFGTISTSYNKDLFEYADGRIQKILTYYKEFNMEDWEIRRKKEYERSGQEIIEKTYWFSQEETWTLGKTTISIYDEHGYITNTKMKYSPSDYVLETITEYENQPGNWELVLEYPEWKIYEITVGR